MNHLAYLGETAIQGHVPTSVLWPKLEALRETLLVLDVWASPTDVWTDRIECDNPVLVWADEFNALWRCWPGQEFHVFTVFMPDEPCLHVLFGMAPSPRDCHQALAYLSLVRVVFDAGEAHVDRPLMH